MDAEILAGLERGFGVRAASLELVRHNENSTFHVISADGEFVLRVHQPVAGFSLGLLNAGMDARRLIDREANLLDFLAESGMNVQRPVCAADGGFVCDICGAPATLYRWLPGVTFADVEKTRENGAILGRMLAKLHCVLREFDQLNGPGGYSYGVDLLPGLGRAFDAAYADGVLSAAQLDGLRAALEEIRRRIERLDNTSAPQTAHCDLSMGNIILCGDAAAPIDFSLSGRAHVHMDIAGVFAQVNDAPFRAGLVAAYAECGGGSVALRDVEPYFAMQIMLFIACQYTRFAGESWFGDRLNGWQSETFGPLARGESFLTM